MFRIILGFLSHEQKTISVALLESTFSDRHIYVTLDIRAYKAAITCFTYTRILISNNDMLFMFCMIYLVCSLVSHINEKGHTGFNI